MGTISTVDEAVDADPRYRERWPVDEGSPARPVRRASTAQRLSLVALALAPWVMYLGLVVAATYLVGFDGDPDNDGLGWGLLGLALPFLFVAARVSRWERRWIRARFELEAWSRGGGGLLDRLLDLP